MCKFIDKGLAATRFILLSFYFPLAQLRTTASFSFTHWGLPLLLIFSFSSFAVALSSSQNITACRFFRVYIRMFPKTYSLGQFIFQRVAFTSLAYNGPVVLFLSCAAINATPPLIILSVINTAAAAHSHKQYNRWNFLHSRNSIK